MGKEKILLSDIISYTRLRVGMFYAHALRSAVVAAVAVGCAASRPDHFTGTLQPQGGACDPPSRAWLTLTDTHVHFTPREGVITLDGSLAADGTMQADAIANGMDHTPYRQSFTGRLIGDQVTGTYITPRCRYAVTLSAPH
ncbi:MAG: hypothetical protein WDN04_16685 [Rhodospirillales bacterium]